jgi:hypothetical protein
MANVGPPGGGGPTIDPVKNIFDSATVKKVIDASKQMNLAMKVMAKNILLASKKRIEANKQQDRIEREYDLKQSVSAAKSLEKQKQAALLKEFNSEERAEKLFALRRMREHIKNINAVEAARRSSERQKAKEYAAEIRKQEQAKRSLESQRSKALLKELIDNERNNLREQKLALKRYNRDLRIANKEARDQEKKRIKELAVQAKAAAAQAKANASLETKNKSSKEPNPVVENEESSSFSKMVDFGGRREKEAAENENNANLLRMVDFGSRRGKEEPENAPAEEEKDKIGSKSGYLSFSESMGVKAGDIFNGGLRKASEGVFAALGSLGGMFKTVVSKFQFVTSAVAAVNPALIMQLGFAFKDLYAVFGKAFQPLIQLLIAGIRAFADFMMPIASEFQAIFAGLGKSILKLFISLFPTFEKIFSIVAIFLQVFTYIIDGITFLIDPIIYALSGFVTLLAIDAAIAVISFAVSVMTMTTLMTAGISILIGAIAWLVTSIFKSGNSMKNVKPGSSTGMGARQASYSGIAEYGKNLMQQSLSGSTQNAAMQTAQYTRESRDFLQQIANKGNGPRQDGGVGVGAKPDKLGGDWGDRAAGWVGSFFV